MDHSVPLSRQGLSSEIVTRFIFVGVLGIFLGRTFNAYWADHNIGLLILFLGELFTFGLVIFARIPKQANRSPQVWLLVAVAIFYVLALQLSSAQTYPLVSPTITIPLQIFGFGFQLIAKLRLGRSFGLLPEDRGLVLSGVYRLVRHPIYFGYLLNHLGFLLLYFNGWNLLVLSILYVCQILRITEEEKILRTNVAYQHYMQKTRYRLVPFIY